MSQSSRWIYAVSFLLAAAGFLQWWPLSIAGVLLCALSGRIVFAVVIGLLLDLGLGAPTGTYQYLFFPFTAIALAAALLRYLGAQYFFDRRSQEHV